MALLDQLFPGLEDELLAACAVTIDFPGDALWLSPSGWSQRFRPGLRLVSCSQRHAPAIDEGGDLKTEDQSKEVGDGSI